MRWCDDCGWVHCDEGCTCWCHGEGKVVELRRRKRHGKALERKKDVARQEELEQAIEDYPYWGC
jgi:hypothetical protein